MAAFRAFSPRCFIYSAIFIALIVREGHNYLLLIQSKRAAAFLILAWISLAIGNLKAFGHFSTLLASDVPLFSKEPKAHGETRLQASFCEKQASYIEGEPP